MQLARRARSLPALVQAEHRWTRRARRVRARACAQQTQITERKRQRGGPAGRGPNKSIRTLCRFPLCGCGAVRGIDAAAEQTFKTAVAASKADLASQQHGSSSMLRQRRRPELRPPSVAPRTMTILPYMALIETLCHPVHIQVLPLWKWKVSINSNATASFPRSLP